jgi:hypothetical protein
MLFFSLFRRKPISSDADDDLPPPKPLVPDPELFELLNIAPWDADQRQQFNNDAVQTFVQTTPEAFRCKYEFKSAGRGTEKRYPLYRIVALGGSLEVVQLVCQVWPQALSEATKFRSTPLHAATAFQASLKVIQYLHTEYPDAISITTKHGYTPLHNACEYGASPEVIQYLVDAHPEAGVRINKLGKTPYQTAQKNNAEPMVLSLLAEYGRDGRRPLSKNNHNGEEESSTTNISSMEWGSEKVSEK